MTHITLVQVDRYHFFPASAASFRQTGQSMLDLGVDEDYHTGQLARVAAVLTQVQTFRFSPCLLYYGCPLVYKSGWIRALSAGFEPTMNTRGGTGWPGGAPSGAGRSAVARPWAAQALSPSQPLRASPRTGQRVPSQFTKPLL